MDTIEPPFRTANTPAPPDQSGVREIPRPTAPAAPPRHNVTMAAAKAVGLWTAFLVGLTLGSTTSERILLVAFIVSPMFVALSVAYIMGHFRDVAEEMERSTYDEAPAPSAARGTIVDRRADEPANRVA